MPQTRGFLTALKGSAGRAVTGRGCIGNQPLDQTKPNGESKNGETALLLSQAPCAEAERQRGWFALCCAVSWGAGKGARERLGSGKQPVPCARTRCQRWGAGQSCMGSPPPVLLVRAALGGTRVLLVQPAPPFQHSVRIFWVSCTCTGKKVWCLHYPSKI